MAASGAEVRTVGAVAGCCKMACAAAESVAAIAMLVAAAALQAAGLAVAGCGVVASAVCEAAGWRCCARAAAEGAVACEAAVSAAADAMVESAAGESAALKSATAVACEVLQLRPCCCDVGAAEVGREGECCGDAAGSRTAGEIGRGELQWESAAAEAGGRGPARRWQAGIVGRLRLLRLSAEELEDLAAAGAAMGYAE